MLARTENGIEDVELDKVTAENFVCPKGEETYYHCIIEKETWYKGTKTSTPRLQIFEKKSFEETHLHNIKQFGYEVRIVHTAESPELALYRQQEEAKQQAIAAATQQLVNDADFRASILAQAKEELKAEMLRSTGEKEPEAVDCKAGEEKPVRTKKTTK